MKILIKNGHVVDPSNKIDGKIDLLIEDKKIVDIGENLDVSASDLEVIDAKGLHVFPGFIDMHCHLRQPGQDHKETIESGLKAAAKGGFTTVCCMPNTNPVIDNRAIVESLDRKARGEKINLKVIGAATKGLVTGELTEMGDMLEAGIVAISNDGTVVKDAATTINVMEYASQFGLTLIEHCEEESLKDGYMHEGYYSEVLGLKGIPRECEDIIVARDILLAEKTGAKLHIAHISSKNSVDLVRQAKKRGVKVSAEVTPQHLSLNDSCVESFDTSTKINPPIRAEEDRLALVEGLKDGTIDIIATDHAPHSRWEKEVEYAYAPFGAVMFETAFSLINTNFVKTGILTVPEMVEKFSNNPKKLFNIGTEIKVGEYADLTICDLDKKYVVDKEKFYSKGKNTPFDGQELQGTVEYTIAKGEIALKAGEIV